MVSGLPFGSVLPKGLGVTGWKVAGDPSPVAALPIVTVPPPQQPPTVANACAFRAAPASTLIALLMVAFEASAQLPALIVPDWIVRLAAGFGLVGFGPSASAQTWASGSTTATDDAPTVGPA